MSPARPQRTGKGAQRPDDQDQPAGVRPLSPRLTFAGSLVLGEVCAAARLIYAAITSLDGYIEDDAGESPSARDFRELWQAADKIVYSRSLESVSSARTRLERVFDPRAIQEMKASRARDITVGGPGLAAQAFRAGLVDECRLFLTPVVVGGGKPALPRNIRLELELLGERRFRGGVVYLHYRTSHAGTSGGTSWPLHLVRSIDRYLRRPSAAPGRGLRSQVRGMHSCFLEYMSYNIPVNPRPGGRPLCFGIWRWKMRVLTMTIKTVTESRLRRSPGRLRRSPRND